MNIKAWEIVAKNWRTVEDTVEKLSIVQKVTKKAIFDIKDRGLLVSARDFLNAPAGIDEDDDLP
ncbi:hypothetical protein AABM38_11160 [Heyndrickxia sp. MSNUG]|uniref:hypothetical protein n=1 Tax=Heyndrickxia sp. MSNUG TaxID=3136677 RepID=UPI003C30D619